MTDQDVGGLILALVGAVFVGRLLWVGIREAQRASSAKEDEDDAILKAMADAAEQRRMLEEQEKRRMKAKKKVWSDLKGRTFTFKIEQGEDGTIEDLNLDTMQASFLQEIRDYSVTSVHRIDSLGHAIDELAKQIHRQNQMLAKLYGFKEEDFK